MDHIPYNQRLYKLINSHDERAIADATFDVSEEQGRQMLCVGGRIPLMERVVNANNSKRGFWWEVVAVTQDALDPKRYNLRLKPTGEECQLAFPERQGFEANRTISRNKYN